MPDARNLMESTRSIGYSLPAAVADIIDNSIAARAKEVHVSAPALSRKVLSILDDGCGMNEKELLVAMKYGSRLIDEERKKSDLGRFGLGLKMASLSQCRRLAVVSKKRGKICGACWDLDHVAVSEESWPLQVLEAEDLKTVPGFENLNNLTSGTLVVWEKLDVLLQGIEDSSKTALQVLGGRMSELKKHLCLVFHRYIEGKDGPSLRIYFNGQLLPPMDPFLEGSSTCPFAEDAFELGGEKIRYQAYVLPHPNKMTQEQREVAGDLQRDQGFYIYRNRRLVIWGTWFRLCRKMVLSKLARVRVDVPASAELDKIWALDVKKSSASVPEVLKEGLKAVVECLGTRSTNVWQKRARREQVSEDAFWRRTERPDGTVQYEFNEDNAVLKALFKQCKEARTVFRLVASRMPLDSLYMDIAQEKIVDVSDEVKTEDMLAALRRAGFDC